MSLYKNEAGRGSLELHFCSLGSVPHSYSTGHGSAQFVVKAGSPLPLRDSVPPVASHVLPRALVLECFNECYVKVVSQFVHLFIF